MCLDPTTCVRGYNKFPLRQRAHVPSKNLLFMPGVQQHYCTSWPARWRQAPSGWLGRQAACTPCKHASPKKDWPCNFQPNQSHVSATNTATLSRLPSPLHCFLSGFVEMGGFELHSVLRNHGKCAQATCEPVWNQTIREVEGIHKWISVPTRTSLLHANFPAVDVFWGYQKINETNCENLTWPGGSSLHKSGKQFFQWIDGWPVTPHALTSQAWKIPVAFLKTGPATPTDLWPQKKWPSGGKLGP